MSRRRGCCLGLALLAGLLFAKSSIWRAGIGRSIEPHSPQGCELRSEVLGVEDLTIHPQAGVAFLSAHDRRARTRGDIYALDLQQPGAAPTLLTADFPSPFRPHGISLLVTGPGEGRLFVVNHRGPWAVGQYGSKEPSDAVELFDYRDGRLTHARTFEPSGVFSANDLAAVGPESYYVTNDHGFASMSGKGLEDLLRLDRSFVSFCEAARCSVQAEGLAYANGVAASPDGRWLYVACTMGRSVEVYERAPAGLRLSRSVPLGTGVDNIELDPQGRLWIGAHPKLLDFALHARDPRGRSPSQALVVTLAEGQEPSVEEAYLNDGDPLSGSSVAAVYQGRLLLGSVFEGLLICPRPEARP